MSQQTLNFISKTCREYIGRNAFSYLTVSDVGLKKFGKDNFYIELQADYGGFMVDRINIKTISKVTDFDKMKELRLYIYLYKYRVNVKIII